MQHGGARRTAMQDHLGGDAHRDLLRRLGLDGQADGHVHLRDLLVGKARLGELGAHERGLLGASEASQVRRMARQRLHHDLAVALVAGRRADDEVARPDGAEIPDAAVIDQAALDRRGHEALLDHLGPIVAGDDGKAGRRERRGERAAHVAAAEDVGVALRADGLEVALAGDPRLDVGLALREHDGRRDRTCDGTLGPLAVLRGICRPLAEHRKVE